MLKAPSLRYGLAALLLLPVALRAQELQRHGRYWVYESTRTHELGAGGQLDMKYLRGKVQIEAWQQNHVEVRESLRLDVFTEGEAQAAVDKAKLASHIENGTLFIGGPDLDRDWIQAHYEIFVPARFQCRIQLQAGELSVTGVRGRVSASTGSGEIDISSIQGSVKVFTGSGEITLEDIQGDLTAETGSGEIDLETCGGSADLRTGSGEVTAKDIAGFLTLHTGAGEIDVQSAKAGADISTGSGDICLRDAGGEITIENGGGGIELVDCRGNIRVTSGGGALEGRRIRGRLAMSTGGGEIDLTEIAASLDISTGGGDISVEMTLVDQELEERIVLATGDGDIELTLPAAFKAEIDAQIRYRRRAWDAFEIDSDFPLSLSQQEDGKYQILQGRGRINGGKSPIQLRTDSGDIRIRRR